MKRSLSLILPVHNAQRTLAEDVSKILDILPDLTRDFELLIIDDGSTDHTREVVEDLAMEYPQIRLASAPGMVSAIDYGVQASQGEMVVVHDGMSRINPEQIVKIWNAQKATAANAKVDLSSALKSMTLMNSVARDSLARHRPVGDVYTNQFTASTMVSSPALNHGLTSNLAGFQLLDKQTIGNLRNSVAAVQNIRWRERAVAMAEQTTIPQPKLLPKVLHNENLRTDQPTMDSRKKIIPTKRPNYMELIKERLQNLAWGE